jgi:hypothetical protein
MRLRYCLLMSFASVLVSGCSSTPSGISCTTFDYIVMPRSVYDVADDSFLREVLSHNCKLYKLCGDKISYPTVDAPDCD